MSTFRWIIRAIAKLDKKDRPLREDVVETVDIVQRDLLKRQLKLIQEQHEVMSNQAQVKFLVEWLQKSEGSHEQAHTHS